MALQAWKAEPRATGILSGGRPGWGSWHLSNPQRALLTSLLSIQTNPPSSVSISPQKTLLGVPAVAQWVKNPTSIHAGSVPGLARWVEDLVLP